LGVKVILQCNNKEAKLSLDHSKNPFDDIASLCMAQIEKFSIVFWTEISLVRSQIEIPSELTIAQLNPTP
jgi:hypothetical protein